MASGMEYARKVVNRGRFNDVEDVPCAVFGKDWRRPSDGTMKRLGSGTVSTS